MNLILLVFLVLTLLFTGAFYRRGCRQTECPQKWRTQLYAEIFLLSQISSYRYSIPGKINSYE